MSVGGTSARDRRLVAPWRGLTRGCVGLVLDGARLPATAGASALAMAEPRVAKPKPGAQMLVEADQMVYDYDNNTVSAVGNVKIYYVGYTLQADRVTYIEATGR